MLQQDPSKDIALRIKYERESRGWSLAELAKRSDVSKAMISKIERQETSPTAALLGRLSGAFQLSLSTLLARAEQPQQRLLRQHQQAVWQDPQSGYIRTQVSLATNSPLELTRIELPAGAEIAFPAASVVFVRQVIWILQGCLTFVEGEEVYHLHQGDSFTLGEPLGHVFRNDTAHPCRYLVAVVRQ
ncbi:helix-turn-helix transcriptional regulator [Thalassomonas viridans]|uniref:Helix-turn-helix transcriptional regulator n=1 Tax=Thalassomonas viridans TaxID=137584 RepID=A0AAF0C7U0_9GAMM|nr:XRE family transcriptional regulator [Thalassomonas viridans]WDE03179.1 helix-turn-helix transcriptional regulator [Thalassomonas viridans]